MSVFLPGLGVAGTLPSVEADAIEVSVPEAACAPF
jgi:hypothetical protein